MRIAVPKRDCSVWMGSVFDQTQTTSLRINFSSETQPMEDIVTPGNPKDVFDMLECIGSGFGSF